MSKRKHSKPTESELEVLHILWEYGPNPVRFVNERLNDARDVGYTTTLKIMQIMNEKGLVNRNTDHRIHVYSAAVQEEATKNTLIQSFLDLTFKGSAMNMIMQTLGNHETSNEELKKIKNLIDQLENKEK